MFLDVDRRFLQSVEQRYDKAGPPPAHRPDLGPCWIWTRSVKSNGYANVRIPPRLLRPDGHRYIQAHRVMYLTRFGSIPAGTELDHLCRARHCGNPEHMEAVTHAENVRRGRLGVLRNTNP